MIIISTVSFEIGLLISLLISIGIFLLIFIPVIIVRNKYKKFVLKYSVALKQLDYINDQYDFNIIPNCDMVHSYDNENFYNDISCLDYLTYQLVYEQKKISKALNDTLQNIMLFDVYKKEIKDNCVMNEFDTPNLLKNKKMLSKFEKNLFKKKVKVPTRKFSINVTLILTNINGAYQTSKTMNFTPGEIKNIIKNINQKRGDYYLNNNIWQSICRVERGKVTNRMRFAIYERDNYRCRKCGRKTNDLEIDHIIPISKGGKSTFENLQTLCHRCNYEKGSNIEDTIY